VESLSPVSEFLDSRCQDSTCTRRAYLSGLISINNFVSPKGHTVETMLDELRSGKMDLYKLLDSFVSSQVKKVSIRTTRLNLAVLRSYLGYHDIDIIQAKFLKRVKVPKLHKAKEEPIDVSDVRKILLACNNRRLKTYMLVLASGGMRTVEALAIRIKDIDFTVNPTKIHIREEYAKTRVARDIYISDEATQYLKAWLEWKYRPDAFNPKTQNKNDLVFEVGQSGDPRALYVDISHEFGKLLDLSGFSEKKDNSPRRKITLHTFRRFVDSTITTQAGQDYAEWFLGHADNSYYNKKEHELRAIYKKDCMKYLTFLDYTSIEATGNSIEAKLTEKEKEIQLLRQRDQVKDQEMQSMKEQIQSIEQSQRQSFEEFKQENHRIIREAMTKFKATLSPKALERFSRKRIIEVLEE
jgi:integrase